MTNLGYAFTTTHPGEILKKELQSRNISQKKFAEIIGVSHTVLDEILNGKRPVTSLFTLLVEAMLGIKAYILVNLQTNYDLQTASKDKKN